MESAKYGRGKGDQLGTTELRPAFSCPSVSVNSYPRNWQERPHMAQHSV